MISERDILQWILDDSGEALGWASGRLIMMRLAMTLKNSEGVLSRSVELALDEFERGNLARILKGLLGRGLIMVRDLRTQTAIARENFSSVPIDQLEIELTQSGRNFLEDFSGL